METRYCTFGYGRPRIWYCDYGRNVITTASGGNDACCPTLLLPCMHCCSSVDSWHGIFWSQEITSVRS